MTDRQQLRRAKSRSHRLALAAFAAVLFLTLAVQTSPAQTYTILYTFQGGADGGFPNAGVYRDAAGNLYGISNTAGNKSNCNGYGCGTVYRLTANNQFSVLHTFTDVPDGWPNATWGALIPDPAGNLYGVASIGGVGNNGTAFSISPSGSFALLHSFPAGPNDGLGPQYKLIRNKNGLIYGTTFGGGPRGVNGYGTVFALTKATITGDVVLHSFNGADGANPQGDIASDAVGNIYGTTGTGGTAGCGTVWKMTSSGLFTVLYNFKCAPDGYLGGSVVVDAQGNVYGGTYEGGDPQACPFFGCGIIFKVSPGGQETILHTFRNKEGAVPNQLIFDSHGLLWGTTAGGGTHDQGTIFTITTDGAYTDVYNFQGGTMGGVPYAGLVEDSDGNFYGTVGGGIVNCIQSGCGMVYKFTPQ
jgi:uncharacterized repeat protein (TIGR03803 family)